LEQSLVLQLSFLIGSRLAPRVRALAKALPAYRSIELGAYAVYPSRKKQTPKVRLLIDLLVDAFSDARLAGLTKQRAGVSLPRRSPRP
jgi:DNA-binding transcriptional LysR family regulator